MGDVILTQLSKESNKMIEKIMVEERQKYLQEHEYTRANGYYTRRPKTILGEMKLNIPSLYPVYRQEKQVRFWKLLWVALSHRLLSLLWFI